MPGAYVPTGGGRSEVLADYLFSAWGTVNPVRWQDDYGVDLFCTLAEDDGKRAIVREYFTVQVKSNLKPWKFPDREAVRWLVQYPSPLFLATVDKTQGIVRVYHVMPRFYVWALGSLPDTLELKPEESESGEFVSWTGGDSYSLSAPIITANLADLTNEKKMEDLRAVFQRWVEFDRQNCDLVRFGLPRFRMPARYRVNEIPVGSGITELSFSSEPEFLKRGMTTLAEVAEYIGGHLYNTNDTSGSIKAALLVRHVLEKYPAVFEDLPRRSGDGALPGVLGLVVEKQLNALAERLGFGPAYTHLGVDTIAKSLEGGQLVREFVSQPSRGSS